MSFLDRLLRQQQTSRTALPARVTTAGSQSRVMPARYKLEGGSPADRKTARPGLHRVGSKQDRQRVVGAARWEPAHPPPSSTVTSPPMGSALKKKCGWSDFSSAGSVPRHPQARSFTFLGMCVSQHQPLRQWLLYPLTCFPGWLLVKKATV